MINERQKSAPVYEALERFRKERVVPFDVPGHKRGRGNPELVNLLGEKCVSLDVNSMKPLDNLGHPVSIIRQAEELTAEAFGAAHAFLMVNGTTIRPGDRLYFQDMAIYSMVKNNTFNGIGLPSIAVMDESGECRLIREFGYEDFKERLS